MATNIGELAKLANAVVEAEKKLVKAKVHFADVATENVQEQGAYQRARDALTKARKAVEMADREMHKQLTPEVVIELTGLAMSPHAYEGFRP